MTDLTELSITSTAEGALRKLKKAEIGVYNCKKQGTSFIFSVKDKDIKKAFAIFAKPCYNISVKEKSRRTRVLFRAFNRIGLFVGAVLFAAIAVFSNSFVFRIKVSGSGSYLSPEVKRIVYEAGAKRGGVLCIDVQIDEEHNETVIKNSLVSDRSGVVKNVVAICGTAAVSVGASVNKGDALIAAYTGEDKTECLAVGYAELECKGQTEYFAYAENDESLKAAYSTVLLYADNIVNRTHTVKPAEGGVIYIIDFTYLHKLSINME